MYKEKMILVTNYLVHYKLYLYLIDDNAEVHTSSFVLRVVLSVLSLRRTMLVDDVVLVVFAKIEHCDSLATLKLKPSKPVLLTLGDLLFLHYESN